MGLGVSEILLVFAIMGGVMVDSPGKLTAPRDPAPKAIYQVIPGAHVAFHTNVQGAANSLFQLLDEAEKLVLVKSDPDLAQGLAQARIMVVQGLQEGGREVHLDLRKDLGTITFSMRVLAGPVFEILLRLRGNFKDATLLDMVIKDAVSSFELKGVTIHELKSTPEVPSAVVCQPDATTILLGTRTYVEQIVSNKRVKSGKSDVPARLKKQVGPKTFAFLYGEVPSFLYSEMRGDPDLARLAGFLEGLDYAMFSAAPKKGKVYFQATSAETLVQLNYLLKAIAGAMGTIESLVDVIAFGALGIAPLVPTRELEPELVRILGNEKGMLDLSRWFKKRFAGKGKVKLNRKAKQVTLEFSNPATALGAVLPLLGGAAYWTMGRSFSEPAHYEEYEEKPYPEEWEDNTVIEEVGPNGEEPPERPGNEEDKE